MYIIVCSDRLAVASVLFLLLHAIVFFSGCICVHSAIHYAM